jgi:hypothetical protein
MARLLHHTTTPRQRRKQLIKTIHLIILVFLTILMLIYYQFHLGTPPPHFDEEDYSFWSHKIRSHLFSLHPSIWEIVENGMHFDSTDNVVFINEKFIRMPKLLLCC